MWKFCAAAASIAVVSCAGNQPPPPERPATPIPAPAARADAAPVRADAAPVPPAPAEPGGGMQMKEVSEKQWFADTREKLGQRLKTEPASLQFSPSKQLVAFVRDLTPPPGKKKKAPPRKFQIVVVDPEGARRATFTPVVARGSDEPPRELRFLDDQLLVYEVAPPPPAPPPPAGKAKKPAPPKPAPSRHPPVPAKVTAHAAPARPVPPKEEGPERLFVVQPVGKRARAIRCQGYHFTFTAARDRLAHVGGKPESAFVAVNGKAVYPRRGHTIIGSDVAWSKDGTSLAFVEWPAGAAPRLVLLAQFDNPTGDTTWDLPATAATDGIHVYWKGVGKLIVGKSPLHPLFATSFTKEKPREEPFKNAGP
jgi:hypothetical protein